MPAKQPSNKAGESRNPTEKRALFERLLSNARLHGTTVRHDFKWTFAIRARMAAGEECREAPPRKHESPPSRVGVEGSRKEKNGGRPRKTAGGARPARPPS